MNYEVLIAIFTFQWCIYGLFHLSYIMGSFSNDFDVIESYRNVNLPSTS